MPLKSNRDDDSSINLTPMIDVVFLLIIFFMVGSRFTQLSEAERDISLQVPQVSDTQTLTDPPMSRMINVYADGHLTLDKEPVTLPELELRLSAAKEEYKKTGVVIRGDGQATYQSVADVLATCRKAEITDLNIAVRPIELK
jgi:biopolymer transport protein ExbD